MLEQKTQQHKLTRKSAVILLAFAIAASIISFFFIDQPSSLYFQNDLEPYMTVRKAARELTDVGYSEKYFILAVAMILIPFFLKKFFKVTHSHLQTSFHSGAKLILSLIAAGITIHFFKATIGRARPHKTPHFDAAVFEPFTTDPHFHSMPSGHSQTIFVLVSMICIFLARRGLKKWNALIIAIGCLLAFTRVITHQHFLSDCIIGATIGVLVTYAVCQRYDSLKNL